ncbi:hypothetical protein BDR03DRAFT_949756 [Suillus americanus]|nr:hypothetical protein BDR03DRAFT_949756 [Suillus americanus]
MTFPSFPSGGTPWKLTQFSLIVSFHYISVSSCSDTGNREPDARLAHCGSLSSGDRYSRFPPSKISPWSRRSQSYSFLKGRYK